MILFMVLSCIGFVLIALLLFTQHRFLDNLLETGRTKRTRLMRERADKEIELNRKGQDSYADTSISKLNYLYPAIFCICLLVAWVLFFVYAASGKIAA
jgi:hypothetical protein